MGNFTYLRYADNKGSVAATTITPSTEASGYLATNLKVLPISKHWRTTGVASENLQFDLGSALPVNLFGIVNHNLSSTATITVNGGSTANPGGGQYTTTVTWREFDAFKLLSAAQTWQYWKFIFVDTANVDGYIKVGVPLIGNATTLDFHWRNGAAFSDEYSSIFFRTPGGAVYAEPVYGIIKMNMQFGPLSVANMATLRTLYRGLLGPANPIFIIPESQTNDGYFGRFVNVFSRKMDFREYVDLSFEEDGRGRDILG